MNNRLIDFLKAGHLIMFGVYVYRAAVSCLA